MSLSEELKSGIAQIQMGLGADCQARLLRYIELLLKWNKVYNLTAINDPKKIVSHHILDSLVVIPYLWPKKWVDVGCGAGLPGLVMAMAKPEWQISLIDSNSKKTSFVKQCIIELGLENASVYCVRVEDWNPVDKFDGIISRAYSDLGTFLRSTRHLAGKSGRWAAMKGLPEQELDGMPEHCSIERTIALQVPGLNASRNLVIASCKENQAT